ncbi:hypothetical protein THAR02_08622 [Trichoderma harzianum]|uniref:Uncharacterized protein n=1 Tax=Trichoderma harzianum TaxID=5544 RepID=A0A0F9XF23_TRIHA|nr:hypothetical protein THAR02_08622 [Trichoderma harzianum]
MPPFERPKAPFDPSQLRAWSDNVEPQMRHLLWGDYWQRFNTIQIPIFGPDVYFENALHIAKLAKGQKEEFERRFEAENKRRQELASKMFTAAMRAIDEDETDLCKNARDRVSELCQTGCYLDFLRLLIGISHGWDEDAAQYSQLDGDTGNLSEETQDSADQIQDSDDEETHHETPWLGDDYYEAPEGLQPGEDLIIRYFSHIFGVSECMSASDDTVGAESDASVSERENKENKVPHRQGKRKRNISDDDAPTARGLRQKLMSGIVPDDKDFPLTPQGDIDWEAIDDELLFPSSMDEYDYDEYGYDEDDGDDDEDDGDDEGDGGDEGDEEDDDDGGDQDHGEGEYGDDEDRVPIKISFFL